MAGSERPLGGVTTAPDGSSVTLHSSIPWLNGEAGIVSCARRPARRSRRATRTSPADRARRRRARRLHRAGGHEPEGQPEEPHLHLEGPALPEPGTYVSFISSEDGEAVYTLRQGQGARSAPAATPSSRAATPDRFDGRPKRAQDDRRPLQALRKRRGRAVGNITALQPPLRRVLDPVDDAQALTVPLHGEDEPGPDCQAVATIAPSRRGQALRAPVLDFIAYLEFERGLSRNTLEAYRSDLLQFGRLSRAGWTP